MPITPDDLNKGQALIRHHSNDLPRLTPQQQMALSALLSGATLSEAAVRAGCTRVSVKRWVEEDEGFRQAYETMLARIYEGASEEVRFTVADAHHMYMMAYRNSANATEQIKATDSLVRLHKLDARPAAEEEGRTIDMDRLSSLPIGELVRLAGLSEQDVLPGDVEDVPED